MTNQKQYQMCARPSFLFIVGRWILPTSTKRLCEIYIYISKSNTVNGGKMIRASHCRDERWVPTYLCVAAIASSIANIYDLVFCGKLLQIRQTATAADLCDLYPVLMKNLYTTFLWDIQKLLFADNKINKRTASVWVLVWALRAFQQLSNGKSTIFLH